MGRGASSNSIPEIENARFLFVIGSNTTEAHPVLALRIKKAVRNGATLVVADPRKIWLTKLAKRHLQLRPGTDVWLINAMMNTILAEGLQNEDYIREFTDDFDAVREVVSRYTPEEAERVTGVPAESIKATAREYASERHAAIFYTLGITEHACGVDNIWSLSEPRLDDRAPRLRVDRPERAPRPEQRPGPERLGREPALPPGLPVRRRPRDPSASSPRPGAPRCPSGSATGSTR